MAFASIKPLPRHKNACIISGTDLSFGGHASASGICAECTLCGKCEIAKKARDARAIFPQPFGLQFGAEKRLPTLDDLQILPELYGDAVEFMNAGTSVEIGGFEMSLPLVIGAMGSTKVAHFRGEALAEGAARAGIGITIGENIIASHGMDGLRQRIKPFLDSYQKKGALVVQGSVQDVNAGIFEKAASLGAMAIEMKIGQGAKQGLGGEIEFTSTEEAKRYREMGYTVVKLGEKFQRHATPGSLSDENLRSSLIRYAEFGLPIWVKTGIGAGIKRLVESLQKIKSQQGIPLKCLTVDGHGGGTGMSPWLVMNETSLPSASLFGALEKAPDFDILLAGGLTDGADIAKAMMLGASGVAMGRAMLIAAAANKALGVENLAAAIASELRMFCACQRVSSVKELGKKRKNLFALTQEAAALFGASSDPKKML